MRPVLTASSLALILCLAAFGAGGGDTDGAEGGDEHAFVEVGASVDACFVHEPVWIVLRFGVDARFFGSKVIQPFRRQLDVPAQIEAGWLDELPGAILLESGKTSLPGSGGERDRLSAGAERFSFALNDDLEEAVRVTDRVVGGRTFNVFEIERRFLPTQAGKLTVSGPILRYSCATRFESDLFSGRVAVDRREATITGEGLTLTVRPLPDSGRPAGFSGAVGRFAVSSESGTHRVEAGGIVQVVLQILGSGNFGFFEPPQLDCLDGFHLYGRIEELGAEGLTVTYDLVPLGEEVKEVPAIPFVFFDAGPPARYRTVRTAAVPLDVMPSSDGGRLDLLRGDDAAWAVPGRTDIFGVKQAAATTGGGLRPVLPPALIAGVLFPPWLLALGLLVWQLKRERDRRDPLRFRARGAAARFRKETARQKTAREKADLAGPFARFLAARLRCPDAAVIDPGLGTRLIAAGIGEERARSAAVALEDLVAADYGVAAVDVAGEIDVAGKTVDALVAGLEEEFRSLEEEE